MRKLFLLLPVFFIAFLSCNNKKDPAGLDDSDKAENSKSIVGEWKVVAMDSEEMDEEEKEDAIKNATIVIRKDGSYTHKDSDGTEDGTYKYDEETNTLIVTSEESENEVEFKISWRGKNLVMKGQGGTAVLSRRGGGSSLSNNRDDEDTDDSRSGSVVGKWRIAEFEDPDGKSPTGEELRQMRSSTIEFSRDGSYTAISGEDDKMKKEYGTYKFDSRTKTLVTTEDDADKKETFDVVFKGRERMVLTFDEGKITLEKD
ncbi:MAG: hypothetical protein HOP10_15095 [Chitinophagaceae bacterium]|nr:hypothetical protein [Chitinophagaceae bacterium]